MKLIQDMTQIELGAYVQTHLGANRIDVVLSGGAVVAEELHRRSPATRSYTQEGAKTLFERAGFKDIQLFSEFTFDPVKQDDTIFVVTGNEEVQDGK